jgi:hypothetical protein
MTDRETSMIEALSAGYMMARFKKDKIIVIMRKLP